MAPTSLDVMLVSSWLGAQQRHLTPPCLRGRFYLEELGLNSWPSAWLVSGEPERMSTALPCLQDRHCYYEFLKPKSLANASDPRAHGLPVSLAAVFDGHKCCEPADLCCKRIHKILAKWVHTLCSCSRPLTPAKGGC